MEGMAIVDSKRTEYNGPP